MTAYGWPGNVRELENAIERAVVLAEGRPRIEPGDLPPEVRGGSPVPMATADEILTLVEVERRHILTTLDRLGGNRRATARALGIGENTLWRKLKTLGLVVPRKGQQTTPTGPRQRDPGASRGPTFSAPGIG